jgi:hypothetical protein
MFSLNRTAAVLLSLALPLASQAALPEEQITASINPELAEHTKHFAQKVYQG